LLALSYRLREPVNAQDQRATTIAKMASSASEMTIEDAWEHIKTAVLIAWSMTTRRMRAAGGVLIFLYVLHSISFSKLWTFLKVPFEAFQAFLPMLINTHSRI
jgi:hypothetical protein